MIKTISELHKVAHFLNTELFEGKLKDYVILVVPQKKEGVLGTCSRHPIWQNREEVNIGRKYEITLSGERLNRTTEEIVGTLLHEMVHLYCQMNHIKDVSGFAWHNDNFKDQAFKHGLTVEKAKGIGWSVTKLKPETVELLKRIEVDSSAFDYWRNPTVIEKTGPNILWYKYTCPKCGLNFSLPKKVDVVCESCNEKLAVGDV